MNRLEYLRLLRGLRWNHNMSRTEQHPQLSKLKIVLNAYPDQTKADNIPDIGCIKAAAKNEGSATASEMNSIFKLKVDSLPPTLKYVCELMDRYKDHVVLTQMGSFYELYFEQAIKYAPQLNISLTSRAYSCGKVPFAGFPTSQLNRHLKVLVNKHGHSVTIADQFKKATDADNETNRFFRRVTRIVTPGTFIDEAFEKLQENSYLLNIEFPENCIKKVADSSLKLGLSWCDISTGEIFAQQVMLRDLISAITRIQPKEILLNESLFGLNLESGKWYPELVELKKYFIKYQKMPSRHRTIDSLFSLFSNGTSEEGLLRLKIELQRFTQKEVAALRNILIYVNDHLPDFSMNFQLPARKITSSIMQIDSRTSNALELHVSVRDNRTKGTLFSTIRRTVTPTGTRLLSQWLSGPSLDLEEIRNRQKVVAFFKENPEIRDDLTSKLRHIHDLPRILQRFSFGRGEALELVQLAQSLRIAMNIKHFLEVKSRDSDKEVAKLMKSLFSDIYFDETLINDVLTYSNEDELAKLQKVSNENHEGRKELSSDTRDENLQEVGDDKTWVVHPSYSENLQRLHNDYRSYLQEKQILWQHYHEYFVERLGAKSVVLKQMQNGGFALHIIGTVGNLKKLSGCIAKNQTFDNSPFHILQQSAQTRWLSHILWSNLGHELELISLKIEKEESNILNSFKKRFLQRSQDIREVADSLGYLDVLASFGLLAQEKNLTCPIVDKSTRFEIVGGRHLMVEDGISSKSLERFTENDCKLESGTLWIITGPNMGGKSTFLRQNAINVILAQLGCFVPCSSAHIGLVDKIFSRVGSADDLYNEMSTFMVEMIETSFILHGATNRSLAILDEIGRGTSSKEGVGIAFATLRYLIENNKCRTLFATHFGEELDQLTSQKNTEGMRSKIMFLKSGTVEISDADFYYDYKLKPGICSKSDAIKVARIAGFPQKALQTAEELLL